MEAIVHQVPLSYISDILASGWRSTGSELDEIVERHKTKWQFQAPVEFKGALSETARELLVFRSAELARRVRETALAR